MKNPSTSREADSVPTPGRGQFRLSELTLAWEAQAGAQLALAFRDNPINRAVINGNSRKRTRVNAYGMDASLAATRRFSFRRVAVSEAASRSSATPQEVVGSLVALYPGGYPAAPPPIAFQLRCVWGQGIRVLRRWAQIYRDLDEHHPKDPHCYLSVVATHPQFRRRGVAHELMTAWLKDVDERQMPGYLETDRRELLDFYGAFGFEVARELDVFDTPVWCMSRPALRDPTVAQAQANKPTKIEPSQVS